MTQNQLTPTDIHTLVAKAFVLEAITDKPGCTSRYTDIPGKPLHDFVIAGINSAPYLGNLARDLAKDPSSAVFTHNLGALKVSNMHKSPKYINFGLLEMLFPTVYGRLKTNSRDSVITEIITAIKTSTNADVRNLIQTRELAWSTSIATHKTTDGLEKYEELPSVWDFYMATERDFDPSTSNAQWAHQYKVGLPILKYFFDAYNQSGEIIKTTKSAFEAVRVHYPTIKIGIIADMCAAAIFLWLSFNDQAAG